MQEDKNTAGDTREKKKISDDNVFYSKWHCPMSKGAIAGSVDRVTDRQSYE